ncbi:inactive tyrosine-protein kinase 7-like isoform X2 [Lineus longissimus]|uniref:inactive tyrosine-protein kinase 7-like isoform X2 n=1 Tax=Lineus longissimus TaxID=88925 RepID=UPI00315DD03D
MDYSRVLCGHFRILLTVFCAFLLGPNGAYSQDNFYFSVKPESQDVIEGEKVILRCDVSNRKLIVFHWTLDEKQLLNTSRRFQDGSNLIITRVNRGEDVGSFLCIATNDSTGYSLKSKEAVLNILWMSPEAEVTLRRPKTEAELAPGVDMTLRCHITGNPEPSYEWFKNGNQIYNSAGVRMHENKIRIEGIDSGDNGIYSCKAKNDAGTVESYENFMLNIPGPDSPFLVQEKFSRSFLAKKNGVALLNCVYQNAASIEWRFGGAPLRNSSRITVFSNGSLQIRQVRNKDAGSYTCTATRPNGIGQAFTSELLMASLSDFTNSNFEPRLQTNQPLVFPVGSNFEVRCILPKGIPNPSYRWEDPLGVTIPGQGRIVVEDTKLKVTSAQSSDSGNYTCVASNLSGEKNGVVWIVVSVKPTITQGPSAVTVLEGKTAQMNCKVLGTPYPVSRIIWLNNNSPLEPHPRFIINERTGDITIHNVHLNDEGNYACRVNTTGHPTIESSMARLEITRRLKFLPKPVNTKLELGSPAKIHCKAEADGKKQPAVKWYRHGTAGLPPHVEDQNGTLIFKSVEATDEGEYTCTAQSETQGTINATITVEVVVKPKFKVKPHNTTGYEGYSVMLHCVAIGDPPPTIQWDKNSQVNAFDIRRFKVLKNGTLYVSQIFIEDRGRYGCTAGNSGGFEREEIFLEVASSDQYMRDKQKKDDEGFSMMKTVIIAVCSAIAYLGLVVGLTIYCSLRLYKSRGRRKMAENAETELGPLAENGDAHREQQELMEKDKRDENNIKSDGDFSCLSSYQSHSTHSHPGSHHSKRRNSYDKMQFPRHDLQTLGMLGKGEFGDVFLARAHGIKEGEGDTLVVVKSLLSKEDSHQFDYRLQIDMFGKLDCDNVVKLLGVCREIEPQFMILEYCEWGDLKQFLRAMRKDNGRNVKVPPLTSAQKITMCSQVAAGMEHLSSHRFVHKDLAARNVLLCPNLDLKISNLGLCRDVYAGEYYQYHSQLMPIRWLPAESIVDDDFSTKSDVWSFGIFAWEVFMLGDTPYRRKTDEEVVKAAKAGDLMPDLPTQSPDEMQVVLQRCWSDSPKDRPSFSEISVAIGELMVDTHV